MSVVIACRNAESTLAVQLDALAGQDCPVPWNVVISDNGSTDGTLALARGYAARLAGLVIVDSGGQTGAGHARNVAVAATRAPILIFCDADDEAAPGWLAAMVTALTRHPFVAGRFEAARLNGAAALRSRRLEQDDRLQESPFGPGLPHAGAGNLGLSRELFIAVGGFDPAVSSLEDTDLCWRIQLTGVPLTFCPDAVMHVRLRSSLRTMWAQGRSYGAAAALLAHRYRDLEVAGTTPADSLPLARARDNAAARTVESAPAPTGGRVPTNGRAGAGGRTRSRRGPLTGLGVLLRERRSLGSLLWTLGWHLGRRRWRPVEIPPAVQALGSPSRQTG